MPPPLPTPSPTGAMSTPGSADPRRYRGAVIGAGGTAQQSHLPAFLEAPSVRPRIAIVALVDDAPPRSEEHTSELQSRVDLVCRLLLEKKKTKTHAQDKSKS